MKNLKFPVQLNFKITSLSNDFTATDANGKTIAYVKQKMFKLKEDIRIYSDETKQEQIYTINANKWLDFSAAYSIKNNSGIELGKIARKGWASLWKAEYDIIDQNENHQYKISEENGWVKVIDSLIGQLPLLGALTGYFFNPSYLVTDINQKPTARLKKEASFWGRTFTVSKLAEFDADDDERIILGLMMMILLERRRG